MLQEKKEKLEKAVFAKLAKTAAELDE